MKRSPRLKVFLTWLLVTVVTFAAGIGAAATVGEFTHSGLGSCGPYGPAFGLLVSMFIGSFPVSIVAGLVAALRADKYFRREHKNI